MKTVVSILSAIILFSLTTVAFAAVNTTQKIAVVDVQAVLTQSPQTKTLADKIKKQFGSRENSLKKDQKTLQSDQAKLDKNGSVMSDKDRSALEDKIISEKSAFQGHVAAFQQDITTAQSEAMQSLLDQIKNVVEQVAKKDGYTLVMEKRSTAYATNDVDITNAVVSAMKKAA
ncbi:MAG: skp [Gammaproteobacteria bacterium]|jgi:outer membrane protein|nr:skp [Gammaproteobacteria bacterium]